MISVEQVNHSISRAGGGGGIGGCLNDQSRGGWPDTGLRREFRQRRQSAGGSLAKIVQRRGSEEVYENYLDVCRELVEEKAQAVGYTLSRWPGHYCSISPITGHPNQGSKQMTHFTAVLDVKCQAG